MIIKQIEIEVQRTSCQLKPTRTKGNSLSNPRRALRTRMAWWGYTVSRCKAAL